MYGSYGMYSGNKSNFSSSANLYQSAGVVNCNNTVASNTQNNTSSTYRSNDGTVTSFPTVSNTSIMNPIASDNTSSFSSYTQRSFTAQHVDYQQNPAPVTISVRQTQMFPTPAIYVDGGQTVTVSNTNDAGTKVYQQTIPYTQGHYVEQYSIGNINNLAIPPTNVNVQIVNFPQNINPL